MIVVAVVLERVWSVCSCEIPSNVLLASGNHLSWDSLRASTAAWEIRGSMSLPYGKAASLQGEIGLKRKCWDVVIFEDEGFKKPAPLEFTQHVQAAIRQKSSLTLPKFQGAGCVRLKVPTPVAVHALAQSIRRWTIHTSLNEYYWHVVIPGKAARLSKDASDDPDLNVSTNVVCMSDIVPQVQRAVFDRDGYVVFGSLMDTSLCKQAMADILTYIRTSLKNEFGLTIKKENFTPMLSIDPKQWASSRFKKGQYSKAFCPKLGGGDFLRADEILKNCHVAQIQIMLKPFVSALASVKQHRLIRVEEGVSLKAKGFAAGGDHLDLSRKLVQVVVCLSERGTVRFWPGSHKLSLRPQKGASHKFATLKDNPQWLGVLKQNKLKRRDVELRQGDVFFMIAGRLLHGIPPGTSALSLKTYARYDPL